MEADEGLVDGLAQVRLQREALTAPVARGAQAAHLLRVRVRVIGALVRVRPLHLGLGALVRVRVRDRVRVRVRRACDVM